MRKWITFNITKKPTTAEDIEKEFEATRNNYLREISKVRKKYETKLLKLASAYGTMSL